MLHGAIPTHPGLASRPCHCDDPGPVPLQLTAKERFTLAMILGLLVLGLIGMTVLREDPQERAPVPNRKTTTGDTPVRPVTRP
jgi:hypothetical protein